MGRGEVAREGVNIDKTTRGITLTFTARTTFIVLAFGVYWGLVFSSYWGTSYLAGDTGSTDQQMARICAALVGQAASFALIVLAWRHISNKRGMHLMEVLGVVLCSIGSMPAFLTNAGAPFLFPFPLAIICTFAFGCGHALLLCRIGVLFDTLIGPSMLPAIAVSAFVSCVILVATTSLDGALQTAFIAALPWACCVCILAAQANFTNEQDAFSICNRLSECTNDKARFEFYELFIQMVLYSVVFALAQQLSMRYRGVVSSDLFLPAVVLTGVALLVYSLLVKRYVPPPCFFGICFPLLPWACCPSVSLTRSSARSAGWS